jgi:outer membrane protein assembly factor BamB
MQVVDSLLIFFLMGDPEPDDRTTIMALKTDLSQIAWKSLTTIDTPWSIKGSYHYRGGIFIGKSNGDVIMLDPYSGHVQSTLNVDGAVRSMGFDNNIVFVGTIKGIVHAIRIEEL